MFEQYSYLKLDIANLPESKVFGKVKAIQGMLVEIVGVQLLPLDRAGEGEEGDGAEADARREARRHRRTPTLGGSRGREPRPPL